MTNKDKRYYFALYFTIVHLTAYVTILVLIIMVGVLIITSSTPMPVLSCLRGTTVTIALIVLMCAEFYSIWRMVQLGKIILEEIPEKEIHGLLFINHPINQILSVVAAICFTLWDILLVFKII
jgi:hypothetical protein